MKCRSLATIECWVGYTCYTCYYMGHVNYSQKNSPSWVFTGGHTVVISSSQQEAVATINPSGTRSTLGRHPSDAPGGPAGGDGSSPAAAARGVQPLQDQLCHAAVPGAVDVGLLPLYCILFCLVVCETVYQSIKIFASRLGQEEQCYYMGQMWILFGS